jgi:hypothetical protein
MWAKKRVTRLSFAEPIPDLLPDKGDVEHGVVENPLRVLVS